MKFRPKNLNELAKLEDEALLAYLVSARKAGDRESLSVGIYVLVKQRLPMVQGMVARKTPEHLRKDLVDEIFGDICESATRGFDGDHMGEFVNFIKTVTSRRIADSVRKNKRQIKGDSLDSDDEDSWGPEPAGNLGDPESSAILRDAMKRVMDRRTEEQQKVILMRLAGKPSKLVVEHFEGQTVANVDQLYFRFRKDLRAELGE